jgi:dihydrofolate synthase/folylpolyglutamate synthase
MAFQETIEYLFGLQKHGIKFGLANSLLLMERMGDPHRRFRSVHIAGTNGKGSTAAFLDRMLRESGLRVGLYTSPHLVSFTERIRINGVPVTEERVVELAARVREVASSLPSPDGRGTVLPTFFEVTTAMAFTCFAEEGVDMAVVETGMGGRLDSTNVITPLVSVITNIDLEHTEFLGTTLPEIAAEKAGIVKQGVPVVTGAVQPDVVAVLEAEAGRRSAPLYRMPIDFRADRISDGQPLTFSYHGISTGYDGLRIGMAGRHQVQNASLALAAAECLAGSGIAIPEDAVRSGLERAAWPGRLERVAEGPDIYLDGAHNPASASVLADALRELKQGHRRLVLVLGILGDKDRRGIIERLVPLADRVVVTKPNYARAMDVAALAREVGALHHAVSEAADVGAALALAREGAARDDLIVVTGSLYTVGDARAALVREPAGNNLQGLKG